MSRKPFRVGRSRTGLGLFATEPTKKRAFIVEYSGRRLTTAQAEKLEARNAKYLYEINSRWTIDGKGRRNLGRYANHSCRPNCYIAIEGRHIWIKASRRVRPGEELAYDYNTDGVAGIPCRCRRGCRHVI